MSNTIQAPRLSKVVDHSATSATFTVEPLRTGYGMTLGNSLRRVLLSSISGAAITSVRINGVSHEFSTIKGVKEDVVEILQNLKGVRFKVYSEEPQVITLVKKGKGVVKAKDFQLNADVELVNPTAEIAHIDDDKSSVTIEATVETGRGYRALDETGNDKKSSDMILLDALFTPVLRVRYKIENTRVGQVTDLDRILLTIDTDGSISPQDAFEEANAILVSQYSALAGQTKVEATTAVSGAAEEGGSLEDGEEPSELMTSVEDLNLSARTTNALVNNDMHTIKDLLSLSDAELRDLKGFGNKALEEVKDKIAELDL